MADRKPFIEARFSGGSRFVGKLAISAMPELIAYEKLVVETAKVLFLETNQTKRRVPKKFERSFSLSVSEIRSGSNVAVLTRNLRGHLDLGFEDDYFSRARDIINKIIETASSGAKELTSIASMRILRLFDRFGTSLGDGEIVRLTYTDIESARHDAAYNRNVRDAIRMAASHTYTDGYDDFGKIEEADVKHHSFRFVTPDDRKIQGAVSFGLDRIMDDVARALATKEYVHIVGDATYDYYDKISEFKLEDIRLLGMPRLDFEARIVELSKLPDGWLDGDGSRIDPSTVHTTRRILRRLVWDIGIDAPYLYPTEDGLMRAEWQNERVSISVEFGATSAYMHVLNLVTNEDFEQTYSLKDSGDDISDVSSRMSAELDRHMEGQDSA